MATSIKALTSLAGHLILFKTSMETFGSCQKVPEMWKEPQHGHEQVITQIPGDYSQLWPSTESSISLKLLTGRRNKKPIIRFRAILSNFMMKNKNQCEIQDSSWITIVIIINNNNIIHTIWMSFNVCILYCIMDQMSPWTF